MRKHLLLLLSVFLLCWPVLSHAATYWVNPAASGQSCTNSASDPGAGSSSQTIRQGLGCLSGGDTLMLKAGTHTQAIGPNAPDVNVPNGSAGQPTTIQAAPGEAAIIRPTACSSGTGDVIALYNRSYITLRGFDVDATNCTSGGRQGIRLADSSHHIIMEDLEVHEAGFNAIGMSYSNLADNIVRRCTLYNFGFVLQAGLPSYGIYLAGDRNIIEHNEIFDGAGWGIHFYPNGSNNTIRYNYIHDTVDRGGILVTANSNNQIYRNVFAHGTFSGIYVTACTNCSIHNNTVYGYTTGSPVGTTNAIRVAGTSGMVLRNNIVFNNAINSISHTGTGGTVSHNLTTDPSFTNAAADDFSLAAGSPAINAGTSISGLTFNGAAPDQGAHETIPFANGTVEEQTPTIATVCVTNNVHAGLLPLTGCTGFTCRVDTVARTINSCARNAANTNCMDLTLASAVTNGQDVDCSYALTGNVSDSGVYVTTEPLAFADQDLTNNVVTTPPPSAKGVKLRGGTKLRSGVVIR